MVPQPAGGSALPGGGGKLIIRRKVEKGKIQDNGSLLWVKYHLESALLYNNFEFSNCSMLRDYLVKMFPNNNQYCIFLQSTSVLSILFCAHKYLFGH